MDGNLNLIPIYERLEGVQAQMRQLQAGLKSRPYLDVKAVNRRIRERLAQLSDRR